MITNKQFYNIFTKEGRINPVQPITRWEAVDRYSIINNVYAESFNLYNGTAQKHNKRMNEAAQAQKINNIIYNLTERALINAGLQVLSKGVIRQLGFYTNDDTLKSIWLMHTTQAINNVSMDEINEIVKKAMIENADSFQVSIVTEENEGWAQPTTPAINLFAQDLKHGLIRGLDEWRLVA